MTRTISHTQDRQQFAVAVEKKDIKIQIGARGQKIGPTWLSVDLFDTSPIIDENWDIHCLPIANDVVDCYVCNAVLEHVPEPSLALYEMHRTLRIGGQIWIEVPFMQFYHAHPHDYYRWTLAGLQQFLSDFTIVSSGIAHSIGHEASKLIDYTSSITKYQFTESEKLSIVQYFDKYGSMATNPRLYSSVYVWGVKNIPMPEPLVNYMQYKRTQYTQKMKKTTYGTDSFLDFTYLKMKIQSDQQSKLSHVNSPSVDVPIQHITNSLAQSSLPTNPLSSDYSEQLVRYMESLKD